MFGGLAVYGTVTTPQPRRAGAVPLHGADRRRAGLGRRHLLAQRRAAVRDLVHRRDRVHRASRPTTRSGSRRWRSRRRAARPVRTRSSARSRSISTSSTCSCSCCVSRQPPRLIPAAAHACRSARLRPASRRHRDRPRRHRRAACRRRAHASGLCDLTAGEMGSNGTAEERLRGGRGARAVLGAALARESRAGPTAASAPTPAHVRSAVEADPAAPPAGGGRAVLARPASRPRRRERGAHRGGVQRAGCAATTRGGEPWRPEWVCYYFINDGAAPSFVVDVSACYERKRQALACYRSQFAPAGADAVATRLTSPMFRQLIESRDAQFGAQAGVAWAEGVVVREPVVRADRCSTNGAWHEDRHRLLRVGRRQRHRRDRTGKALAARGHDVHLLSSDTPFRWRRRPAGPVVPPGRDADAIRCSASRSTCCRWPTRSSRCRASGSLDIVHAHYAVPHATAAYLARQILAVAHRGRGAAHGDDAARHGHHAARQRSVVFGDRRVLHRAVRRRDRRVREPASATRYRELGVTQRHPRHPELPRLRIASAAHADPELRARLVARRRGRAVVMHVSNFRPVKRVRRGHRDVRAGSAARARAAADGRRRPGSRRRSSAAGARARADVGEFLGEQDRVVPLLSIADLFLLPSAQESFGLAALEAMACEVPWWRRASAACPRSSRTA